MRKSVGFTLMEMVIVIVIIGVIAAFSSKLLNEGFKSYLVGKSLNEASWNAKLALARMALDFRMIGSQNDITTATATQFVYNDINTNTITYQLTGSTLTRNGQILANNVSNLTFTYYNNAGGIAALVGSIRYVNYSLTVTVNNETASYQSGVYIRDRT